MSPGPASTPGLHIRGTLRPGQHQGGLLLPAQAALPPAPQQQPPDPHQVSGLRGACNWGRRPALALALPSTPGLPWPSLLAGFGLCFPSTTGTLCGRGCPDGRLTSQLFTQADGEVGPPALVPGASRQRLCLGFPCSPLKFSPFEGFRPSPGPPPEPMEPPLPPLLPPPPPLPSSTAPLPIRPPSGTKKSKRGRGRPGR